MSAFAGGMPPEVTGVAHSGGKPSVQLAAPGVIPCCDGTGIGFVFVVSPVPHASTSCAGIRKRVYPHLLRHSLATNLMHSGTRILAIKQQMGHAHLGTTMRYLHGDPERLKQEFLVHVPDYLSPKTGNV